LLHVPQTQSKRRGGVVLQWYVKYIYVAILKIGFIKGTNWRYEHEAVADACSRELLVLPGEQILKYEALV
jgi:hypothetical protein